jgi:hypothetical protein
MPTQDFDIYHGGSVGPPQGWVVALTGSAAATYGRDVQGGYVTLATGATQESKAVTYLDTNLVIPGQEGSFQIHLPSISAVTSVCIRVGLMPRASWVAHAAAGVIPGMTNFADYFLYEFDTFTGSGTSTAATTGPPGTMTDGAAAWTVNQWAGFIVTSGGKTLTVASNTATVITGTAGWSGGGNPGAAAYTIAGAVSAANWVARWRSASGTEQTSDSGVAAVTTTTKLIGMVDLLTSGGIPLFYANGVPHKPTANTGVSSALMTPGVFITTRTTADRNLTLDSITWEGRRA